VGDERVAGDEQVIFNAYRNCHANEVLEGRGDGNAGICIYRFEERFGRVVFIVHVHFSQVGLEN
jgi:hypothetical protein